MWFAVSSVRLVRLTFDVVAVRGSWHREYIPRDKKVSYRVGAALNRHPTVQNCLYNNKSSKKIGVESIARLTKG